jgi:uncharacterized membrane protein
MILIQKILHALSISPVHSMLVHFPIALSISAFFFILVALLRKSDTFEKVAWANISLAAVSSLVAGAAGMFDNLKYYNGLAPNALAKIILVVILFLITIVMAIVRLRTPDLFHKRTAKWIYVLGYFVCVLIVSVLGFLGGVIIYGM